MGATPIQSTIQGKDRMPTYDFRCPSCSETTSLTSSIQDYQSEPPCPACKEPMRRIFGAPLITFKGQGFNAQSG